MTDVEEAFKSAILSFKKGTVDWRNEWSHALLALKDELRLTLEEDGYATTDSHLLEALSLLANSFHDAGWGISNPLTQRKPLNHRSPLNSFQRERRFLMVALAGLEIDRAKSNGQSAGESFSMAARRVQKFIRRELNGHINHQNFQSAWGNRRRLSRGELANLRAIRQLCARDPERREKVLDGLANDVAELINSKAPLL